MNLNSIPAFQDNYIWVLTNNEGRCLIVDPGDAKPVLDAIAEHNWQPEAILLTHHHQDHVGGVKELREHFPKIVVYGPAETQDKGTTQVVQDGETAFILGHEFSVFATPGHTLGHICYFSNPYLFCGDTLFSAGCGRLFEGTAIQMYQSLKKYVRCLMIPWCVAPMNILYQILSLHSASYRTIRSLMNIIVKLMSYAQKNQMTLPVTLKNERQNNIFLRTEDVDLIKEINKETILQHPEERFAWLRSKKDRF